VTVRSAEARSPMEILKVEKNQISRELA